MAGTPNIPVVLDSEVTRSRLCGATTKCEYRVVVKSETEEADTSDQSLTEDKKGETVFDMHIEPGSLQEAANVSYKIYVKNIHETEQSVSVEGEQEVQDVDLTEESLSLQQTADVSFMEAYQELHTGQMHYLLQARDNAAYWETPLSVNFVENSDASCLLDTSQHCHTSTTDLPTDMTMYLNLGQIKQVSHVSFYQNQHASGGNNVKQFTVQTSTDGETFTDVATFTRLNNYPSSSGGNQYERGSQTQTFPTDTVCGNAPVGTACRERYDLGTIISTQFIAIKIDSNWGATAYTSIWGPVEVQTHIDASLGNETLSGVNAQVTAV